MSSLTRNLIVLLAHDKKDRIEHVDVLADPVQVDKVWSHKVLIHRDVLKVNFKEHGSKTGANYQMVEDVGIEERHDQIVGDDNPLEAERFSVSHQPRAEVEDDEVVGEVDGQWDFESAHHWIAGRARIAGFGPVIG